MIARAIASICFVCACMAAAPALHTRAASAAPLVQPLALSDAKAMETTMLAALGSIWGERELHDLLAAFQINTKGIPKPNDFTSFLQNRPLGVELTFRIADARDVPGRELPPATLVLSSIRLYGPGSRTHKAFKGELPFGLRFGVTKEALIAKFGLPDRDRPNKTHFAPMRWDTQHYALFVKLDEADRLKDLSLQLPVVETKRPGFETR